MHKSEYSFEDLLSVDLPKDGDENISRKLSLQQVERLAFIDYRVYYLGDISRQDIGDEFKITDSAASGDLKLYREFRPENITIDGKTKKNTLTHDTFHPLIKIKPSIALDFLVNGFSRSALIKKRGIIDSDVCNILHEKLNSSFVACITRAIKNKTGVLIKYFSNNSENREERIVYPVAVFDVDDAWYFRALDATSGSESLDFKSFKFSRLINAAPTGDDMGANFFQDLTFDAEWNTYLPIDLCIHPKLEEKSREMLSLEYGFKEDCMSIQCRLAFLFFFEKKMKIDTRDIEEILSDQDNNKIYFNFYIKNMYFVKMIKDNAKRMRGPIL